MDGRKAAALLLLAALAIVLLSGCSGSASFFDIDAGYGDMAGFMAWGESAQMDYEVPESVPNVLADQYGYQCGSRKVALFKGEGLGSTYRIINEETGNVAYQGRIEPKGYDEAAGTEISYGNFTDFNTPGSYYIETSKIGRSYSFYIGPDIYAGVFERAYQELLAGQGTWNGGERCYVLAALLTSYELYPHIYDGDGDGNAIADVLDFSRRQVEQLVSGAEADPNAATPEAAMVLAQFSRIYKDYDKGFSADCLRSAEKFWAAQQPAGQGQRAGQGQPAAQQQNGGMLTAAAGGNYSADRMYLAETQLYRATGNQKYQDRVSSYLQGNRGEAEDGMRIFADVAYLSTESPVDLALCRELMADHMEAAERYAEESQRQMFLTAGDNGQRTGEKLLLNMVELAFVDYVITNHEYANVMENHLHYLLGRNPEAVSLLKGFGDRDSSGDRDILSRPARHADFVFMMGAVMNHQMDDSVEQ